MASRRSLVCICRFSRSPSVTHVQQVHDLLSRFSLELSDSSYNNAFLGIISQVKISRSRYQEISDHLIVNLDVSDVNIILVVFVFIDSVKNVFDSQHTK